MAYILVTNSVSGTSRLIKLETETGHSVYVETDNENVWGEIK